MSTHEGHRNRMWKRFLEQGLDGFDDHQVLEMLLFYAIPRKDTNELAHDLIETFGSLSSVLEASVSDLQKVHGIGQQTANMISFVGSLVRYYLVDKGKQRSKILTTLNDCVDCLRPFFVGRKNETVYMLCLDAKCKLLTCKLLGEGSVNSAAVPMRKIVETAMASNATSVILAHNHPSGVALPSGDDVNTTKQLAVALQAVDVILADHIIFSDDDSVSLTQSGHFQPNVRYTLL